MPDTKAELKIPKLAVPAAATEAVQLAHTLARPAVWARRIVSQTAAAGPVRFSQAMAQRFETRYAPGARAASFAKTLLPDPLRLDEIELTVSPYAPPMRQLGSVRQGVPMWRAGEASAPRAPAPRPSAPPTSTPRPASRPPSPRDPSKKEIPPDLIAILNMHRALGHID